MYIVRNDKTVTHVKHILFLLFLFSYFAVSGQDPDSVSNLKNTDGQKGGVSSLKDTYHLVYDGLYDMNGSAQNLLSISNLAGRGLDELACKPDSLTGVMRCVEKDNVIGRILIDGVNFLFTTWISTVQHETMGHGFRVREFDVSISGYNISPSMFGDPHIDFNKDELPYYGKVLQDVGGSEANTVFAREAFRQGLVNEYFHHYYMLAFAVKLDMPLYIIGSPEVGSYAWNTYTGGGWDVVEYIKDFEAQSTDSQQAIYKAAHRGALWSLMDPSLLISLFKYTRDFIIRGRADVKNPMISIGPVAFLPFTDFHLSPYGYEYYGGAYLKYDETLFETYYRWSSGNVDGKSYGIGVNVINLLRYNSFSFDAGIDIWKQEFNLLYHNTNDDDKYHENILSGKIYARGNYKLKNTFSFLGQLSYKGEGFLLGNPVENGLNAKIGMGFYF